MEKGNKTAGRQEKPLRLDRLLAREGFGTRSELKKAIRGGLVLVNGSVEKDPGRQISREDEVLFDTRRVGQEQYVYYMLHKPAGVITATEDGRETTVLDLLRGAEDPVLRRGLFPVGRLDRDTEGLLLITDDGALAHRLLAPGRHVDKVYYAAVSGTVTREDICRFEQGIAVDGTFTAMPAGLEILPEEDPLTENLQGTEKQSGQYTHTLVTIREGKFHQIKRMFAACGKEVIYLKRLSMGPLQLDPTLAPGQWRPLTPEETDALRRT